MVLKNTENLSDSEIRTLVNQGGKFVMYKYCISILIASFNNPTDIYFIKPNESSIKPAIGFLFTNLILGWWGIPWGPIYTIGNIASILGGGKNVTYQVMDHINQTDPNYGTGTNYNVATSPNASTYNVPGQGENTSSPSPLPIYNIPNVGSNNAADNNKAPTYNLPQ